MRIHIPMTYIPIVILIVKIRTNTFILREPLYIGIYTCMDNRIKVPTNRDIHRDGKSPRYDYLSLRNTLREEMDKDLTLEQAEIIGNELVDLYSALYFDEIEC